MNKLLREGPDGQCNTLIDNQFAAGNFPMANYKRGQTVTLAWPAKNHVPETCDNNPGGAGLPDTFNGLYMEEAVPGLRRSYNREVVFEPMTAGNTHVRNTIDYKGFGKCPKFCENRDKALCTGQFVVPDVPDGKYSFSWRWEFNPGEMYVTCFEAQVQGSDIKPENGDKWDQGGVGMFVERNVGCNDHTTEDKCLSYADGRGDRTGQRCAWCCGDNCNAEGGPGGPNKCEPVAWMNEHGLKRFKTAGSDNCSPPTAEPTTQPTPQPTVDPTPAPTSTPTDQMMAPSPVGGVAGAAPVSGVPAIGTDGCAPPMGQCAGNGMTGRLCCSGGYVCTDVTNFFSQCQ